MEFSTSDLIASMALIVSMASLHSARRQTRHQSVANATSYRSALAEHHRRYAELVAQVAHAHQARHAELSSLAGDALRTIPHLLDDFDLRRDSPRRLRHLLGEAAEMVYLSFNGQLGWQTAENLTWRFSAFDHVEDRLNPQHALYKGSDFRRAFRQRDAADPNRCEDHCLVTDQSFCALVETLQTHLDPQRSGELLSRVASELQAFSACHDRLRQAMRDDAARLQRALDENRSEQFDLTESPSLFKRLEFEMRRLETLAKLHLPQIDPCHAHRFVNYTSICIQVCALLYMVQGADYWRWGKFLD